MNRAQTQSDAEGGWSETYDLVAVAGQLQDAEAKLGALDVELVGKAQAEMHEKTTELMDLLVSIPSSANNCLAYAEACVARLSGSPDRAREITGHGEREEQ